MALVCLAQLWYLKEDLPSTSVSFPVCKGKGLNQKQQEQETCGTHAAFHSGSRGRHYRAAKALSRQGKRSQVGIWLQQTMLQL